MSQTEQSEYSRKRDPITTDLLEQLGFEYMGETVNLGIGWQIFDTVFIALGHGRLIRAFDEESLVSRCMDKAIELMAETS